MLSYAENVCIWWRHHYIFVVGQLFFKMTKKAIHNPYFWCWYLAFFRIPSRLLILKHTIASYVIPDILLKYSWITRWKILKQLNIGKPFWTVPNPYVIMNLRLKLLRNMKSSYIRSESQIYTENVMRCGTKAMDFIWLVDVGCFLAKCWRIV